MVNEGKRWRRKFATAKTGFSAYSAKVGTDFAIGIRAILGGSVFLRQTGFHFAGKAPHEADLPQMPIRRRLLAILLDPGGSQASKAVLIDGKLPGEEFVDGQRVTAASFLEGKQAAADRGNDFGLATDNPSLGPGCGQICDR
jgi:hypothetical protein